MNKRGSDFLTFRRATSVLCGLLLVVFGSLYFFNVSAQTEDVAAKTQAQTTINGKIAFRSLTTGQTTYEGRIGTMNQDGTGATNTTIPLTNAPGEQAWSPDGTKFVYVHTQTPVEIYVANADGSAPTNISNTPNEFENNPAWSANGKIAYERGGQIWTMNPDGSGQAQFTAITQPSPTRPAWSFDGSKLAFASGNEIWIINADGSNQQRVTNNSSTDSEPAWSPDGTKIVFAKGGSGISVVNADGTNETPLTTNAGDTEPNWSPDGTKIAFARDGIYTMDINGANQVRIIANKNNFPLCCNVSYRNPTWQPFAQTPNTYSITGRVTYNNTPVSSATVNLTGTTTATTTTDSNGNYQFSNLAVGGNYTVTPVIPNYIFTPANRSFSNLSANQTADFEVAGVCIGNKCVKNGKIAFMRNAEIFTINPDGSNETNITNNAAIDGEPNYSPFGTTIVFTSNRDGNNEIYRMNADGSNVVRLTNNAASDSKPYYSPNGASIVFTSNRDGNYEIYKMNADGSNPVRLTNNVGFEIDAAFSPDGSKIVYVEASQRRMYTMNADGSNQQALPHLGGIQPVYERPTYSPDGTKIMFTYSPDSGSQVRVTWAMNADGSNPAQHPSGSYGVFSPDGTKVVYTCCILNNTNYVGTVNVNGTGGRTITPSNTGNYLPVWQPLPLTRKTPFDYDGDGKADISVFRPSENKWYILQSSTASLRENVFALAGDVPVPADYDGDGKTDVAIYRSGAWWYLSSINGQQVNVNFGAAGDIPRPSDFDGDGKTDFVLYRPSNSTWYRMSATGQVAAPFAFGIAEDKPLVGDFDGDGKSEPAIFRPSSGDWWYAPSSFTNGQFAVVHWGASGDIPTPADVDADGKTDFMVYRPSNGGWYILRSGEQNYTILQFGLENDKPVVADYDGDGKADVAVFRPSSGTWYLLQTTSGFGAVQWGNSLDIPTEGAFQP